MWAIFGKKCPLYAMLAEETGKKRDFMSAKAIGACCLLLWPTFAIKIRTKKCAFIL